MSRPTATSGRKKLLLILLAVCALLLAATLLGLRNMVVRNGRRDEAARSRGETHLREHRTGSALYQFRLALKINPENLAARVGIVRALTGGKQFDRAIAALRAAVEHGLSPVRADRLHARILASRAEHRFASAGDTATAALCDSIIARELDPAIALIERRLGAAGDQVATLLMLGNLFAKKSGLLRMEHHLLAVQRNRIRDLNRPALSDGISRQMLNLIPALRITREKCLGTYRKAIRLAPDSYEPRLSLAEYALSLYCPRPDLATEALKPLLAERPAHRRGLYLAALAERAEGNFQTALAHIRALRKKPPDEMSNEPDNITLVRAELEILIDMKRWREAAPLSAQLLKLARADPFALYIRGLVLLQRQKPAEACNLLQAIFTNTGRRRPLARFALAKALEQLGNRQQAVATFMRVIEDAEVTPALDAKSHKEILAARYESDVAIAQDLIRGGHFRDALKFASNASGNAARGPKDRTSPSPSSASISSRSRRPMNPAPRLKYVVRNSPPGPQTANSASSPRGSSNAQVNVTTPKSSSERSAATSPTPRPTPTNSPNYTSCRAGPGPPKTSIANYSKVAKRTHARSSVSSASSSPKRTPLPPLPYSSAATSPRPRAASRNAFSTSICETAPWMRQSASFARESRPTHPGLPRNTR